MPQRRDHVLRHANTTTAARRSSRLRNASSHVYEVLIYDHDEEEWIPAVVQWMFFKDKSDKGNMPSRDQGSQLRAELCIKPGHYHAHYAFYSSAKASTGRTAVNSPDLWEGMSTDSNHPSPAHGEAVVCKTEHAEDGDHHNATPGEHPAQDTSTLSEPRRLAHHRARIHLHEAIPRAALCPLHASLRSAVDLLDISSEVQTYTSHSPAMASLCTSPAAGATATVLSCPTTYHTATNTSSVPAHVPSCGARSIPSLMEAPQTCRASTSHAARSMSKNQHHNADGEMLARFGDSISSVEELLEVYLCGVTLLVDPGVSSSSSSSLANSFFASTPNSPALTGSRGDGTSARKPTSRSGGFGGLQQRYARMKRSFLKLLEPSSQSSSPSGKASQASASFASPFIQHGAGEALPPQARVRCVLRCLSEEDLFSFLHDAVRAMGTGDGPDAPSDPAGRMMMMHQQRQRFLRRVDPPSLSSSLGDNVNDDEMDEDVGCGCLSLALRATQLDNPLFHPCLREANFDCWPCFVKYRRDPRHGVPFARVPPLLWHSYLDQAPRVLYTFQRGQLIVEEGSGGSSRLSTAAAAALAKGIQRTTNTNITSSSSSSTTTLMRSIGPENEVRTSSRLLHPTEERRRRGLGIEEAMRAEEHSAPLCLRDLSTSSEELRQPARFSDIFLSISESDVLFLNALGELKLHLALTDLTAVLWYAPYANTRAHKPSSKSSAASRRRNSANAASTSSARSSCAFGGASASLKPFCCFKCRDGDGAGEPPLAFTFSFLPIYGSTLPHHLLDNPPLQPASPSLVAQRGISCPSDAELGDAPRAVIAALQALMGKRWTSMNLSDYLAHGEAAGLGVGGDGTKLASSTGANRSSWMAHAYGDLAPPRPPARTIFVELTAEEVSSMLRVADEEEGSAAEVLPAPRSSDGRPPLLRSYEVDGQRRRPSTTSMDSGNVRWTGESTPLSLSVVDSMSNPAAMVVTRPRSDGGLSSTQMELALRMAAHPMPLQLNKSDLFLFDEPEESEVGGSMAYADPSQKGKDAEEGDGLFAVVHPRRKG